MVHKHRTLARNRSGKVNKKTVLFAAALIAVIIFSVVFTVWFTFVREEVHPRDKLPLMFKCRGCGHEFGMTVKEHHDQILADADPEKGINYRDTSDCPECGLEHGGDMMIECPKCKKYFVAKSKKKPICTHCGADYFKILDEQGGAEVGGGYNVGRPSRE
jgi:hypothetical protein